MDEMAVPKNPDGEPHEVDQATCYIGGEKLVSPATPTPREKLSITARINEKLHPNQLRPHETLPGYFDRVYGGSDYLKKSVSKTLENGRIEVTTDYDRVSTQGYQPWRLTTYRDPASSADAAQLADQLGKVIADGNQAAFVRIAERRGFNSALEVLAGDANAAENPDDGAVDLRDE